MNKSYNDIHNTLKDKLFTNADVLNEYKDEFKFLHHRIFPDKNKFIKYLTISEEQEKKNIAKDILLRFCYESNIPPLYQLEINILHMEGEVANKKGYSGEGYVGKDHFLHQINLYLLGIYLYFYSIDFNNAISNYFLLKREDYSNDNNLKINSIKDFLSSWKYFVLFHDIAYPFEYFIGSENNDEELKEKILNLYNRDSLNNLFVLELVSKVISRLIIMTKEYNISNVDIGNVNKYLETKKIYLYKGNTYDETENLILNIASNESIMKFQNIHIGESLKLLLSIFDKKKDIISVAYDKKEGHILAILTPYNEENVNTKIMYTDYYKKKYEAKIDVLKELKDFFNDETIENGINVDYYVIEPKKRLEKIVLEISSFIETEYEFKFDNFILMTNCIFVNDNEILSTDVDFKNYSFEIYKKVRELLDSTEFSLIKSYENIISNAEKVLFNSFVDNITYKVKKDIPRFKSEKYNKNEIQEEINDWFDSAIKKIKELEFDESTKENFVKKYQTDIQYYKSFYMLVNNMQYKFREFIEGQEINLYYNEEDKKISDNFKFNENNKLRKKIKKQFMEKSISIDNIDDWILNYKLKHTKCDHGIYGAKIFLQHYNIFKKCCFDETLSPILKNLSFMTLHCDKEKMWRKYNKLIVDISYAVLIHNIYPKNFVDENYKMFKTKISSEPFAYFSMLCDSIQHWDRPYILNPALNKKNKTMVLSKYFNIELTEKKIIMHIKSDDNQSSIEYIKNFALALAEFLEFADVKVSISINQ